MLSNNKDMSKIEQTSDNPQTGNSSLGGVMRSCIHCGNNNQPKSPDDRFGTSVH